MELKFWATTQALLVRKERLRLHHHNGPDGSKSGYCGRRCQTSMSRATTFLVAQICSRSLLRSTMSFEAFLCKRYVFKRFKKA